MELGRASGSPYLGRDRRARLDLLDGARAADRPSGDALEVFAREHPSEFGICTTSGPTPFSYRYRFTSDGADTVVHLDATVELPRVAAVLGPLAARGVKRGVDGNHAALKRTLEGGGAGA
jgi:hypothetical protein